MNSDLVSVIMPTYNRAKMISLSLESVYAQTYRPIEVVVVDDGSKDETEAVVNKWRKEKESDDFKLRFLKQKNGGAPVARNHGLKECTGRYVQFMDSDDLMEAEKLELQIRLLQKEGTPLCICDYYHADAEGAPLKLISNHVSFGEILALFFAKHTMIGVFDLQKISKEQLKWNPTLKKFQDRDLYLKVLFMIDKFSYVEKPLFKWIRHDGERIFTQGDDDQIFYWDSFVSLFSFYIKNYNKIEPWKRPYIRQVLKEIFYGCKIGKKVRYLKAEWYKITEK